MGRTLWYFSLEFGITTYICLVVQAVAAPVVAAAQNQEDAVQADVLLVVATN
ncbi:hypothetical protein CHU_0293 [Cytophaga hutchinsonii ATCC 33406]|uniref:Uncharacterized protein n=1 Tax=Cytophaga hutchinsonii (strain ATCC 33406 / DSM 1761 / CIP 103989 / NBRC 15051 / NCIMB 9469 / D465) TaxID=269798 RepID=A0A6N4SMT3_CYTH3|nr:hypothetical protein CHU_0293 [Cytophaga hutchinsonii ATCC 33406]